VTGPRLGEIATEANERFPAHLLGRVLPRLSEPTPLPKVRSLT